MECQPDPLSVEIIQAQGSQMLEKGPYYAMPGFSVQEIASMMSVRKVSNVWTQDAVVSVFFPRLLGVSFLKAKWHVYMLYLPG